MAPAFFNHTNQLTYKSGGYLMTVHSDGPVPASVLIVGEAPGADEERLGKPFVGAAGYCLDQMLSEAGISRGECRITNVCRERPPNNDINFFFAKRVKDRTPAHVLLRDKWVTKEIVTGFKLLILEVEMTQPKIIVPLGNISMWALTGKWGISKWRGSMLYIDTQEMRRWL